MIYKYRKKIQNFLTKVKKSSVFILSMHKMEKRLICIHDAIFDRFFKTKMSQF